MQKYHDNYYWVSFRHIQDAFLNPVSLIFFKSMAAFINVYGVGTLGDVPRVSRDYQLAGSTTIAAGMKSSRKVFLTREEKYLRVEQHFPEVYKEEWDEDLPKGSCGLVVIQQGHYPLDCDIAINPALKHHCAKQAIMIGTKVMRQPYVFVSKTYWLRAGKRKLECLLDCDTALIQRNCSTAVARYIELKGEAFDPLYMGTQLCSAGRFEYPYRVWRLQRRDLSVIYLLVSLLNGAMFELLPQDLPEMREAPSEFMVGVVQFKEEGNGDYFRG